MCRCGHQRQCRSGRRRHDWRWQHRLVVGGLAVVVVGGGAGLLVRGRVARCLIVRGDCILVSLAVDVGRALHHGDHSERADGDGW